MSLFYVEGDPVATALSIVVALVGVFALFRNIQLGIALLLSLFTAWIFTMEGLPPWHAFAMLICGVICCITTEGDRFVKLDIDTHELNYAVAFIFPVRAVFEGLDVWGKIHGEAAIIATYALLVLQLIIVLGGCVNGERGRRFNDFVSWISHRIVRVVVVFRGHGH